MSSEEKDDPMIDDILSSIKSIVNEGEEDNSSSLEDSSSDSLLDDDFESLLMDDEAETNAGQSQASKASKASKASGAADQNMPLLDMDEMEESILSTATANVGAQQFIKLNNMIRMGNSNVTLSDIVRSLLRPMLREWLDENLPTMVERMVEYEIKRLVSRIDQNGK